MSIANRIRVLQLGSPTGLYGAERWILALVKHLKTNVIESIVGVIKDAPGGESPLCAHAARMGLSTHVFRSHGKLSLSAIGQLRQFIHEQRIDILHTHGYKTDVLGILASRGTHCKLVSTPHGWSIKAGLKLQAYEWLDRSVLPMFDAVVPLSRATYDELTRIPGIARKLHMIQNGVDLSEIDAIAQPAVEVEQLKRDGYLVVGYIGQLIPRKGIDTLLKAFSRVALPKKRLCIVGEGSSRRDLEHFAGHLGISEEVIFFGFRSDRIALLNRFDAFVLPSYREGIPRCLMEAMALGVPVLATDIPGCRDLVEDNVTGLLFPVDDDESLADRLSVMLADSQLRDSVARGARALIRSRYTAEAMASRYAELYAGLVCNHAR